MRYGKFGKTGMEVSKIAAGTWGIGGTGWGGVKEAGAIAAIKTLLDGGVNMIDTAPFYGAGLPGQNGEPGLAERIIGKAIKGYDRSKIFVVTKVGVTFPNGGNAMWVKNLKRESILKELEDSLKNLATDYIDLYVVHWPDVDTKAPLSESFSTLAELKQKGKIRHIGVSNFSQGEIEEAGKYADIEALQPQHSMVSRESEPLMKWAHGRGMANMAYGPLGAGILTGRYRTLPKLDENDWRAAFYPFFKEPVFSQVQVLLKTLDAVAAERGKPLSQVAINWSAQHPLVDTALLGVSDAAHAAENIAAMDWSLSPAEIERINQAITGALG